MMLLFKLIQAIVYSCLLSLTIALVLVTFAKIITG